MLTKVDQAVTDTLDVDFSARLSSGDGCTCDACHDVTKVTKLKLPTTKYFDGTTLSTQAREYWLCCTCLTKLEIAIDGTKELTKNDQPHQFGAWLDESSNEKGD